MKKPRKRPTKPKRSKPVEAHEEYEKQGDEIDRMHGRQGGGQQQQQQQGDKIELALRILQATDHQTGGEVKELRAAAAKCLLESLTGGGDEADEGQEGQGQNQGAARQE